MTESSLSQVQKGVNQTGVNLEGLARDATVALIIKAAGLVMIYLAQIFLARWMGKTEYGIYQYVVAWSFLLAMPAGLGLPRTTLRMISEYRVKQDWASLRGILRGSWLLTIVASILLCLGTAGIILFLNHYHSFVYAIPMLIGMGLIPLQALVQLQMETTRAMNDIALAYVPYQVIWPVLVICGGFLLLEKNHSLTSLPMLGAATVTLLVVVLSQSWLLREKVNREIEPASPVYDYRKWIGISLILLIQRAFFIILNQTDVIMVGSLIGPGATGLYNAAAKTSQWASSVLNIVLMVAAPAFATLYAQKDMQGLQKVVSRFTIWIFWPSIVIGICLLTFTQPILSLFGSEFIAADWTLKVLVLGRLVNALCGTVSCIMMMTGHQKESLPVFGYSALINLVLNAIAIPRFGIVGAAMTTTFTMVVWNIWLSTLVVKYLGIRPSILYSFFARENQSTTQSSDS